MNTDFLHVTQKIDIVEQDEVTQRKFEYFSRVEDIGETSLYIQPPYRKGLSLGYRPGRVIRARVAAEGCAYLFDSALLGYIADPTPLWEISKPRNIQRIQMREHVRLNIVLDVRLEFLDNPGDTIQALTKDISAGGVQVVFREAPPDDSPVKVFLPLTVEVAATGKVIRRIIPETPEEKPAVGIKFDEIDEKTRNQIIKYIFGKQAEWRQKEKGLYNKKK